MLANVNDARYVHTSHANYNIYLHVLRRGSINVDKIQTPIELLSSVMFNVVSTIQI